MTTMDERTRPGPADEMTAKRIVMKRKSWGEVVALADAMSTEKGCVVPSCDVIVMAIEAGIAVVRSGSERKPKYDW